MFARNLGLALGVSLLTAVAPVPAAAAAPPPPGHRAHTNLIRAHGPGNAAVPAASPSPVGFIPCDIVAAYRLDQAPGDGAGLRIAVIDAYGLASAATDYNVFNAKFPGTGVLNIQQMDPASPSDPNAPRWADEIDLDVEWAHAIAPKADIYLVAAKTENDTDMTAAIDWAVQAGSADIVLMAWSVDGAAPPDTHFPPANGAGQPVAYVGATGDHPPAASVGWPSNSPHVIGAGGTTLRPQAAGYTAAPTPHDTCAPPMPPQGAEGNESAWAGAVSGLSQVNPRPAFQAGVSSDPGHRVVPDVALTADFNIGLAVYSTPDGGWTALGGDSGAAVIMAGILARIDAGRAHITDPAALYLLANPSGFSDVTAGTTWGDGTQRYSAHAGFDFATGWGSPRVAELFPRGHFKPPVGGPSRILDTRAPPYNVGPQGMLQPSTAYDLTLPSPPPGMTPSAVVLNVTATDAAQPGFVAAYGGDASWKGNSNLNFAPGQASTNLVTAPVGNGKVHFISSTAVDLVVDLFGWYSDSNVDPASGGRLIPMSPTRIIDSRPQTQFNVGAYNTLWPCGPGGREIHLPGSIPGTASAVVINVTAVNASLGGFLGVFPTQPWPGNSNVNYSPGPAIPNRVIVPLDPTTHTFWVNSSCPASVDVIIDLSGYYGAEDSAVTATVAPPTRIYDSRLGGGMVTPGNPRRVQVGGASGVPLGIKAAALNVTVTDASTTGYVAAYPDNIAYPGNSDLSAIPGVTTTNLVIVPVPPNGYVDFAYGAPSGGANLIVDLISWFG